MNDNCRKLIEQVSGGLELTAADQAHLVSCPACRAHAHLIERFRLTRAEPSAQEEANAVRRLRMALGTDSRRPVWASRGRPVALTGALATAVAGGFFLLAHRVPAPQEGPGLEVAAKSRPAPGVALSAGDSLSDDDVEVWMDSVLGYDEVASDVAFTEMLGEDAEEG
jgi:hypothetical protein